MAVDEGRRLTVAPTEQPEMDKAEHRRILVIIGALMLGMILASLDQTIVSTALPTIALAAPSSVPPALWARSSSY